MTNAEKTEAQQIAALNDAFRSSFGGRGQRVMTQGIATMPLSHQALITAMVMQFTAFTPDNDPHGEHDFGAFDFGWQKIFWKIDVFSDDTMQQGIEDHTNPAAFRVLTVMLASEY